MAAPVLRAGHLLDGHRGAPAGPFPERGVVIANHLGYLDVIAFAALHRCVFIGKSGIRRWPLLGWMAPWRARCMCRGGGGGGGGRGGLRRARQEGNAGGLGRRPFPGLSSRGHHQAWETRCCPFAAVCWPRRWRPASQSRRRTSAIASPRTTARISRWPISASGTTLFAGTSSACSRCAESRWRLRFAESPIAFSPAAADRRIAAPRSAWRAVLQLRATVEAEALVPQ